MTRLWIGAVAAVALTGLANPSDAGSRCNEPYAPTVKINASATSQDMATLRDDVQSFIAASDLYQSCLLALGESDSAKLKIHASQAQKQQVGQQLNAAIRAFNSHHS